VKAQGEIGMLLEFQEVTINVEEDKSDRDLDILTEDEQSEVPLTGSINTGERGGRVHFLLNNNNTTNYNSCTNSVINKMTLTLDPENKPLFTITPTASVSSMDESVATPSEVAIGIHESDSTTKLQPDGMANQDSSENLIPESSKESWSKILLQVFIPFFTAGLGMVGAGLLLDFVKEWPVFKEIPEFLILVTPLLGLKGNLEMTLASRLSTHANLGHMESGKTKWRICFGNLSLIQVQAVVVGFLASCVAILIGFTVPGEKVFVWRHALLLCTASILTAAIASFVLGLLMVFVILLSTKCNVNPDNIATPVAASLGDITTLGLLAYTGSFLYTVNDPYWLCPLIIGTFVFFTPLWIYLSYTNEYTKKVLTNGWLPVIMAMLISSGGGFILDKAEQKFSALALYQPVINGVGGNLVSVQASRISTALHRDSLPGKLPGLLPGVPGRVCKSPWTVFMKNGVDSTAARVLLGIVIPGHLIFSTITHFVSSDSKYSVPFLVFYLTAAFIQVAILLYLAQILVAFFWWRKSDPDTNAIPYLTALGDLLGTGLLYAAFEIVAFIG
ncbi:Solute carrier family 41 member 2, partial [Orchesella cincta]